MTEVVRRLFGRWVAMLLNLALRLTNRKAGVAVVYHRVGSHDGNPERELVPRVERSRFRRELRHLRRHYEVVRVDALPAAVATRRRMQPFPVCVTFDDDDPDHIEHAMPILQQEGVPAAFFLCGACIEGRDAFWWQRLQRAVDTGVPLKKIVTTLPSDAAAELGGDNLDIHRIAEQIERLRPEQRDEVDHRLLELAGPDPPGAVLDASAIAGLAKADFTIGFHTQRHDQLTELDDDQLESALHAGRDDLARLAGQPLEMIAYPHGEGDGRVAEAARRAGFRLGFRGWASAATPSSDPLLLGRLTADGLSLGQFALGLAGTLRSQRPNQVKTGITRSVRGVRTVFKRVVPERFRRRLRPHYERWTSWPPVGQARFGSLRRLTPISRNFGFERGQPIDRYYIDCFLRRHTGASKFGTAPIRGEVLEIGEPHYVDRFGDPQAIERIDILDVSPENERATIVADLVDAPNLPSDAYDCVICTQTLLLIYDLRAALRTLHRILKPGGTLLATVPGISQVCRPVDEPWEDHWRFTTASARRLFEEAFEPKDITVEAFGNVLTAAAFLYGLAAEDLSEAELDARDPDYQLLVAIKAVKRERSAPPR